MTDDTKNTETEEIEETSIALQGDDSSDEFVFVEDPAFEVDYKGDCAYEVKVSIPAANRQKTAEELYDELKGDVELPGFRKGRAPVKLVEKKFSKVVEGEVKGKLVAAAFEKLVKDEDLKPAGYPDVDGLDGDEDEEPKNDEALVFTLKFEVAPRVELGKYRGVKVERPIVKIDDTDQEDSLTEMLARHATYEELEGGIAALDDQVIMDFTGTVDGEEFSGGAAENYPYILGSKRFFPEFEEVLLGSSPGDELSCQVDFPEDYFSDDVKGKTADFTIKVSEVKRKVVPELTDDFAKELGYEGADDMREQTRKQLEDASAERTKQIAEGRALEAIVEECTFEIPQSLIDAVSADTKNSEVKQLIDMRIPPATIEEQMPAIEERAAEQALLSIKNTVVLNEIGDAEGVEVTDEDFEKEAESLSRTMGADVEMVAQYISQGEQRSSYADRIFRAKALAVIMDNAKITDKELSREEMDAAENAADTSSDED